MKDIVTLNRNRDFNRMYSRGKSYVTSSLVVYVLRNRQKEVRIGITTSKKIGNAVTRNRCRRRLKEAVFTYNDRIINGFDIVFVARHTDNELPFEELCKDIGYLLNKSEVLSK